MKPDVLHIVLVDDHPIVLEGLKALVGKESHLCVTGAFTSGSEALEFIKTQPTDVVLLDISLPDINGADLCREIKKHIPRTIVLILSNHTERSIIMQAIQSGANGYFLKNTSLPELRQAIYHALDGNIVFGKAIQEIISHPLPEDFGGIPPITKREKEILGLVAAGKTSNDIAKELFLSVLTVDTHRKNLIHKFKVKNVAELISEANRLQLLS